LSHTSARPSVSFEGPYNPLWPNPDSASILGH